MKKRSEKNGANTLENTKVSILPKLVRLQNEYRQKLDELEKQRQAAENEFMEKSMEMITKSEATQKDIEFEENKLVDANTAAEFLGTTVGNIYQLVHFGKIPYSKIGKRVKFRIAELKLYMTGQLTPEQIVSMNGQVNREYK